MIGGPNDTLDCSDYPPATREELELSANLYAERAYKLGEENKRLRDALILFTKRGIGLYFDTETRRDGMEIIKCRQCNGWSFDNVDDFCHESKCLYTKARAALMAGKA